MGFTEFIQENDILLLITLFILGITIIFCLLRAFLGPRFTDRVLAVNVINVKTVVLACVIGIIIEESYVIDIAIVYALLSYLSVVVLNKIHVRNYLGRTAKLKEKSEN